MQAIIFLWYGLVFDQEFLIVHEVVNTIIIAWAYYYQTTKLNTSWNDYFLPEAFLASIIVSHHGIPTYTGPKPNILNLIIVTIIIKK